MKDKLAQDAFANIMDECHVQVRLGYIENSVPGVEALVEEAIKILGKTELMENFSQVSHTVELCLVNTSSVCIEGNGL